MKKKIILRSFIIMVLVIVLYNSVLPYTIKTSNIISNQKEKYSYERISISDYSLIDYNDIEGSDFIKYIYDDMDIKASIDKIDSLQLRRTKESSGWDKHITVIASYSPQEGVTYTEGVFSMSFGVGDKGDNILGFGHKGEEIQYYKILDKNFDIEAFFKELMSENIS